MRKRVQRRRASRQADTHTHMHGAGVNALGVSISFRMGDPATHVLTHAPIPPAQSRTEKIRQ